ncbi:hypothetical protein Q4F19_13600 [Sphingomonas sp. BIUV-7]|uniref:Uncharacterized protein n=1 Tax=Sphingomonas natans TaxID=3063330 RepID=A0ABT8YBP1_9SPHN|nr:hypothetical protein [Sphingomonas sp. BIUV-7]MDO6415422.1 hypothetical protein [Sphingomonas sp. BIUV-7]
MTFFELTANLAAIALNSTPWPPGARLVNNTADPIPYSIPFFQKHSTCL